MKGLVAFKSKLFRPFQVVFKFKLKKSVLISRIRVNSNRNKSKTPTQTQKKRMIPSLFSALSPLNKLRKMGRLRDLRNASEEECERMLFPSPVTPAYSKANRDTKKETFGAEQVEEACRSFENYLVEMIVDEGKVSDLMDVEELLYCWRNLKCPVFIDLVCGFYGELCKDLFMPEDDHYNATNPM